jgi:nucleoside-diphosphate-sugar epimerase
VKALVTGATGFLGGALARRLIHNEWDVHVLVRSRKTAASLEAAGAQVFVGDVEKPETLPPAIRGVKFVFHAAAHVDLVKPDRDAMLRTNVEGTRNVLAAAQRAKVRRVVHFSSVAAIGRKHEMADESVFHDGDYESPYEESKHKAEQVAFEFGRKGLDVVHVLPCVVLGPGDPKSGDVILRYLRRQIPAVPKPDGTASFAHVDDVVEGVLLAARKGGTNERYIFSQVTWTTSELMAELEAVTGIPAPRRVPRWVAMTAGALEEGRARLLRRPPRVSRNAVRLATRRFGYSSAKARRELGWQPRDFQERFRDTVAHWQAEVARAAA